jgi:hypothetical protein
VLLTSWESVKLWFGTEGGLTVHHWFAVCPEPPVRGPKPWILQRAQVVSCFGKNVPMPLSI